MKVFREILPLAFAIFLFADLSAQGPGGGAGTGPNQFWKADGNSATDPNLHFLGTTDFQDLSLRTNSIERMRITGSGRVGIGYNVAPNHQLHIKGIGDQVLGITSDDNGSALLLRVAGPVRQAQLVFNHRLDIYSLATPSLNIPLHKMAILENGNIGIGTDNPVEKLHVVGSAKITSRLSVGVNCIILDNTAATGATGPENHLYTDAPSCTPADLLINCHQFSDPNNTILNAIDNNGLVGIGTPSPMEKLHVEGNTAISGNLGVGIFGSATKVDIQSQPMQNIQLRIRAGSAGFPDLAQSAVQFYGNSVTGPATWNMGMDGEDVAHAFRLSTHGTGDLGNTTRLTVTREGLVGIGAKGPIAPLTVAVNTAGIKNIRTVFMRDQDDANEYKGRNIYFVHNLSDYGYNPISRDGDMGLFYANENLNSGGSAFVIAPHNDQGARGIKIHANGNVGIGTPDDLCDYKLAVEGTIGARRVKVTLDDWCDYVFEPDYDLMPLHELEGYIKANKHLPEIPAAEDVIGTDIDLVEMQTMLLKKIEELTLYVIEQEKEISDLRETIDHLNHSK